MPGSGTCTDALASCRASRCSPSKTSTSRSFPERSSDLATARQSRGAYGERRAAAWYEQQGFTVLARNWRAGRTGELDLVVRRDDLVVICEVKARATAAYGVAEAVTATKQARIRVLAAAFLREAGLGRVEVRFDVVCLTGARLEAFTAAF